MTHLWSCLIELKNFLNHICNIHLNMQFIMETELVTFPSWKVTYTKDQMASWGRMCTGNPSTPTLTWIWSHYHPANKLSVLPTLVQKVRTICNQESLPGELEFLTVCSNRMATVTGRSIMLSINLVRRTHLEKNRHQWPSYPLWDLSSTASAGY
jgi:hypothetical protein